MEPWALSRDGHSRVYVADGLYGRVQILRPDGRVDAVWGDVDGANDIGTPVGIAHAAPDHTFVADAGRGVLRLDAGGQIDLEFGTERGAEPGQFGAMGPTDLATAHEISSAPHHLRVIDPDNARVQLLDSSGTWVGSAGSEGDGDGQFCKGCPSQVAGDLTGRTHVADHGTQLRVQVFDVNGQYDRTYFGDVANDSRITEISDLAFEAGAIYMAEMRNRVQVLDVQGAHVTDIDTHRARPDMVIEPRAIVQSVIWQRESEVDAAALELRGERNIIGQRDMVLKRLGDL
jgi:hypothetical protein